MYKAAAALKTFFSSFGLPAYQEGTIPDDVTLPYIAFSLSSPEWDQKASLYVKVWDRTTSNAALIRKADQITAAIGGRKRIALDGDGHLVIWPETPEVQIQADGDFRFALINLSINAYHLPGV